MLLPWPLPKQRIGCLGNVGKSPIQVTQGREVVIPSSLVQQVAAGEIRLGTNSMISHDEETNQ